MIEVADDPRERLLGAGGLRDHPRQVLVQGAGVGETRECVGGSPDLGDGEVAEVRKHGCRLSHGLDHLGRVRSPSARGG